MADIQIAVIDEKDTQIALAVPGVQGPAGAISSGGSANQVFYKVSGTNYDAGWTFIGNANVDASAEIAVSKLADGAARQLLQTDAAGTGVEWASNIDIPGTLDVTSAATFDSTVAVTGALTKSGSNVVTVGDTGTVTSTMLLDGTILDADINASAEIAVSKLADGSARQLLQTDTAGTGVEWASNIDIPGTLDVTGVTVLDAAVTIANLDAVATTKAQYEESQIRLNAAFSIGTAGVIPFGVGPAIPPGMAFFGIGPDAYNPIHLLSGSFC